MRTAPPRDLAPKRVLRVRLRTLERCSAVMGSVLRPQTQPPPAGAILYGALLPRSRMHPKSCSTSIPSYHLSIHVRFACWTLSRDANRCSHSKYHGGVNKRGSDHSSCAGETRNELPDSPRVRGKWGDDDTVDLTSIDCVGLPSIQEI